MFRTVAHSAFGLMTAAALALAPSPAQAQYIAPSGGVGLSIATPGFSLGIGQPIYRPYPVVAPVYPYAPYAPVYSYYGARPVVPVGPYVTPYRGYYNHGYSHYNGYGPRHYGRPF